MKRQKLPAICLAVLFMLVETAEFESIGAANAQDRWQSDSRNLISQVGVRGTGSNQTRTGRRGRHKKHRGHNKGRHRHKHNGAQNWSNQGSNSASPRDSLGGLKNDGNSSNWNALDGARQGKRKHGRQKRRHGKHNNQSMQMPGNAPGSTNPAGGQFGR